MFKFKQNKALDYWGAAALTSFFMLAVCIKLKNAALGQCDRAISVFFYEHRCRLLTDFFQLVSNIGRPNTTIAVICLLAFIFYYHHFKILSLWLLFSTILGNLLWQFLKLYFARPRPLMTTIHGSYSFPSGHATSVVIFAVILISLLPLCHLNQRNNRLIIFLLLLFAAAVCISRIYLQAHYLSDVVSGAALAFSWIVFMRHIYNKFAEKLLLVKMLQ